jgi:hypothetical protein
MVNKAKNVYILILLSLLVLGRIFAAEDEGEDEELPQPLEAGASVGETIPDQIRRPRKGETLRYPRDAVIGELGRGNASEDAYRFARDLLNALVWNNEDSAILAALNPGLRGDLSAALEAIGPQKYRIGGGKEETDGAVSFLFRFIGRELGIAGELYLRRDGEIWRVDDIITEDPRDAAGREEAYPYDFTPYELFF